MQKFERSVLIIAFLILIVALTIIGLALKQSAGKSPVPPAACPDFWFSSYFEPCSIKKNGCCEDGVTPANDTGSNCETAVGCNLTTYGCCADGFTAKTSSGGENCSEPGAAMCYNVHSLPSGTTPYGDCSTKDPADFLAKNGQSTLCQKQEWAKRCKVSWDGVTNVNSGC